MTSNSPLSIISPAAVDMTFKLKEINLHNNWKVDDTFIQDDIIHLYYKDKYYITINEFHKCGTTLQDIIKRFNRDIKIKNILEL
jgi:hypothetical protein